MNADKVLLNRLTEPMFDGAAVGAAYAIESPVALLADLSAFICVHLRLNHLCRARRRPGVTRQR